MDGRELIIVAPINVDGELEQSPIIQKINIIINFINKNRYRLPADKDNEYKQKNPQADMRNDIELRERIARDLNKEANVLGMFQQVQEALNQKYKSETEREQQFGKFTQVADHFFKHIQFAHLTAVELAIVGMMVDTLLILLYQARNDLQDDAALISVVNKQNELLRIRDGIAACMAYHKTIFDSNNAKKDKEEFNCSDIVINLFEAIEKETGTRLVDERKNLWPDMSYLQILPEVSFYKLDEPKTVARYFAEFSKSLPPGVEDVDQLTDEIRQELRLMDEVEERAPQPVQSQVQDVPTGTGCFAWFWSRPRPTLQPVEPKTELVDDWLDLDSERSDALLPDVEKHTLDDVIRLMSSFNHKAQEQLDKMDFEQRLRIEIMTLQYELQHEIVELQEPNCFSFFWTASLRKKLVKEAALDYVLRASTLDELGQRAHEKLHGDDKDMVCAGWHSRTEAKLKRIVDVVQFQLAGKFSESVDLL